MSLSPYDPTEVNRAGNTMESGRVLRYHAAPSVPPQNVGHHSWGVAILALYVTCNSPSADLLKECLMHDAAEYFTGDVPFTVKRDNLDIKKRFDAMEDTARITELIIGPIELNPHDMAVMKFCDTLEGFIWCCKNEHGTLVRDRWEISFRKAVTKLGPYLDEGELVRTLRLFEYYGGKL